MALPVRISSTNGKSYGGATSTTQATTAFAATAGNHIAVAVWSNGVAVSSVTDTAGNTYVKAGGDTTTLWLELWYAENIAGHAANVVTVTYASTTQWRDVTAVQHAGIRTTGSLGAFASNTVASGTTISCLPSVAYLGDQVCVAAAEVRAAATFTFTPAGFTALFSNQSASIAARTDLARVFDGSTPLVATSANSANIKNLVAAVFLGVETSPAARVSHRVTEVLGLTAAATAARVTQAPMELLALSVVPPRVTQAAVEVLTPNRIVGAFVAGQATTVTASLAAAFGLDGATHTHSQSGLLQVYGDLGATGTVQVGDVSGVTATTLLGHGTDAAIEAVTVGPGLELVGNVLDVTPSLSASAFFYRIDTAITVADPGLGKVRYNHATQASATVLIFDWLTDDGFDTQVLFQLFAPTTRLLVQEKASAAVYQRWDITATATNLAGYFTVPVTFVGSGGSGVFANGTRVAFIVLPA